MRARQRTIVCAEPQRKKTDASTKGNWNLLARFRLPATCALSDMAEKTGEVKCRGFEEIFGLTPPPPNVPRVESGTDNSTTVKKNHKQVELRG